MRVLFDQGTPAPLRRQLVGHTIDTVYERGWSTLKNGALLSVAEQAGYDVLVTTDQQLRYQQNLTGQQTRHCGFADNFVAANPAARGYYPGSD